MTNGKPPGFSTFTKNIKELLVAAISDGIFPGAAVGVSLGGTGNRCRETIASGYTRLEPSQETISTETFFDLASLTKPLATTLGICCLLKENKVNLDDPLTKLLPSRYIPKDKIRISLRHLLAHCSGLPAYRPFYKHLMDQPSEKRKEGLIRMIFEEPLEQDPGQKSCYSDLDFMLLGVIIEEKSGQSLDMFTANMIYQPLEMDDHIFFLPLDRKKTDKRFAATENCPWRGKVLQGEVHDDNAWALGGVAGHAGLFGDIEGVLTICTNLLDQYHGRSEHKNYRRIDLRAMVRRYREEDCWALGFDTPSTQGSSSGRYFSAKSFGHLGFTGTSFWIDPVKELVVVLLTNRVHPERSNDRIKKFRPFFHDSVMELLHLV